MVAPDYLITTQYPGSSRQADRSPAGPASPAHFSLLLRFLVRPAGPPWPSTPSPPGSGHHRSAPAPLPGLLGSRGQRRSYLPGSVPRREPLHRVDFHTVERVESIDIGSFGPKPTTPNPASHDSIANDNRAWHQPFPEWWVDWMRKPLPVQIRKQ